MYRFVAKIRGSLNFSPRVGNQNFPDESMSREGVRFIRDAQEIYSRQDKSRFNISSN